ncbi:MAG: bifunctional methylenetetrahydrofolate dehydrogenase/methenyltetrahydrofolate cyclohydrolase FolD [Pseudomonadota bacterium]
MTTIIDGKNLGLEIQNKLAREVASLKEKGINPGLAVILVGDNPASKIYVKNKQKACEKIGINSFEYKLATTSPQSSLEKLIHQLNQDKNIHGILIQLPLPSHIDTQAIIEAINPAKDVDGFHPENMGKLLIGLPCLKPCTPLGILEMLDSIKYDLRGKQAVVIGRSTIVGKPLALMLLEKHATVTICHSRTKNLPEVVRSADLVVAAIGRPKFVQGDWIKKEAVVIDVGINRLEDGTLVGDVDFEAACKNAAAITPVPKGVGPMTIALLLKNTLQAARDQNL